jgi:hypothetical protein
MFLLLGTIREGLIGRRLLLRYYIIEQLRDSRLPNLLN